MPNSLTGRAATATFEPFEVAQSWPRRVLVATDGSSSARPAMAAAGAFASRSAAVELVAVYSPRIPLPASPSRTGLEQCETPDRREAANVLRAVRAQSKAARRERPAWTVHLEVGDPGSAIVRVADECHADLVVLGIGAANPVDRPHGMRTPACVARFLEVPLFAVAPGCHVPARCVVAFPDGRVHEPTLRAAIACVPPGATIWLAFPEPHVSAVRDGIDERSARAIVSGACDGGLEEQANTIEFQRVEIVGDILTGILSLAGEVDARLIAIPNYGMPGPVRLFLPNLAEPLLLAAECSMLIVPDTPRG